MTNQHQMNEDLKRIAQSLQNMERWYDSQSHRADLPYLAISIVLNDIKEAIKYALAGQIWTEPPQQSVNTDYMQE